MAAVPAGRGALAASVTAPLPGSAEIEVFDTLGRRVLSRVIDGGSIATREVRLAERGALAPGVYLLRLRQGAQTAGAKATVL